MTAALKYILVPEQNYHALMKESPKTLTQQQQGKGITGDDLDEKAALEFVKKNLSKAQKGKKRNLSAKNVLFNQRLRSYLRARNRLLNKPMKVHLESFGNKLLSSTNGPDIGSINEDGDVEPIENYEKVQEPEQSFETYKSAETSARKEEPSPRSRRRVREKQKASEKKIQLNSRISKLVQLVSNEPSKFGLIMGDEGNLQIENPNTKKPVNNSDLFSVVTHMVDSSSTWNSPPGTRFFKKKLLADETARDLVDPKYLQYGQGCPIIAKEKLPKICKKKLIGKSLKNITIKFRPMEWRSQRWKQK